MNQYDEERLKYVRLYAKKIRETKFNNKLKNSHARFINSQIEMANVFYKNLILNGEIDKFRKLTGFSENQTKRLIDKFKTSK